MLKLSVVNVAGDGTPSKIGTAVGASTLINARVIPRLALTKIPDPVVTPQLENRTFGSFLR